MNRDSCGLFCPNTIKDDAFYNPGVRTVNLFKTPAKYCILNYLKEKIDEIFKSNLYHNKTSVPMGLSQQSFNNNHDDECETFFDTVNMCPDPNPSVHKSQQLTSAFYVMLSELTKCGKVELFKEIENYFDQVVVQCCETDMATQGRIVSSHPPNSKRRQAQGISNML